MTPMPATKYVNSPPKPVFPTPPNPSMVYMTPMFTTHPTHPFKCSHSAGCIQAWPLISHSNCIHLNTTTWLLLPHALFICNRPPSIHTRAQSLICWPPYPSSSATTQVALSVITCPLAPPCFIKCNCLSTDPTICLSAATCAIPPPSISGTSACAPTPPSIFKCNYSSPSPTMFHQAWLLSHATITTWQWWQHLTHASSSPSSPSTWQQWQCCKVAPESWGIGGSKVVSSNGLEGYEMFNPRDSRREDREEENA